MNDAPKYTLLEAREAVDSLVQIVEFAFFTALSDLNDDDREVHVGPVDGGGMEYHKGRHDLVKALVERLVCDDALVMYPALKPHDSGSAS